VALVGTLGKSFAQQAGPIFKAQTVSLDCVTLEEGTEIFS